MNNQNIPEKKQKNNSALNLHMNLAMQNGLKLSALFGIQALSMLLYRFGFISSLLFIFGFVAVPVYIVLLGNQYRDKYLSGRIRYFQAVGFLTWCYLFSLIIATVIFFVVFTILFRDSYFLNMMDESILVMEDILQNSQKSTEIINSIRMLTPKSMTFQFAISALFFGTIYIYIVGIFIRRKA